MRVEGDIDDQNNQKLALPILDGINIAIENALRTVEENKQRENQKLKSFRNKVKEGSKDLEGGRSK